MKYRRRLYRYGDAAEVYIFPVSDNGRKGKGSRGKRRKPSRNCQRALNNRHRAGRLGREIAFNFGAGDCFLTLTYKNAVQSYERAHKDIVNFISRYKRALKRAGFTGEVKYIYVSERGRNSGRWHHHIILSGELKTSEIQKLWGLGYVDIRSLEADDRGSFSGLANYMCKYGSDEDNKQRGAADIMTGGRIHRSRNIRPVEPAENDFEISRRKAGRIANEIEAGDQVCEYIPSLKGYNVYEKGSFFNEIDGCYYLRLILIKVKKHRKGKRV